jgi:hypothetical protein
MPLDLLTFSLTLVLVVLSGLAGLFIAHKAHEELDHGKKHFLAGQRILLILSAGLVALTLPRAYIIPAYLILGASLLLINKEIYTFMILGGSLAATFRTAFFPYQAGLTVLYVLCSSALLEQYTQEQEEPVKKLIGRASILYGLFIFAGMLGFLL